MLKEFKDFIMRGNVLELAVAVIIAGAFGAVVASFTNDVIMPPIGLALGSGAARGWSHIGVIRALREARNAASRPLLTASTRREGQ